MPSTIPFAQYIFKRLAQLNCKSVHGVPGDFFLRALDHLPSSGSRWIGNANELCAGYAADGYARACTQLTRHRLNKGHNTASPIPLVGACLTTYGVGELSAINALAGSYAENIPVLHMAATPSRLAMNSRTGTANAKRPVHHTLADDRMEVFADMAKFVTCAQARLHRYEDVGEAAEAFDEVLEMAVRSSKPGYVSLPCDIVELPVRAEMLDRPLRVEKPMFPWLTEDAALDIVLEKLRVARRPLVIADGLCYPFQFCEEVNAFVTLTGIPAMSLTSGKGVVDENLPSWDGALPNTTAYSQEADLVLFFGPLLSDTNTARWSAIPEAGGNTIMFNLDSVEIAGQHIEKVSSKILLQRIISRLKDENPFKSRTMHNPTPPAPNTTPPNLTGPIRQDDLWPAFNPFLRENDTLLFANGTPLIGARAMTLPPKTQVIASPIWNAIGSMLPCAQGLAAAKRDHNLPSRTILFEGDGSFQVTCQAISDIIRYKLDVTVFVANNGGYTYERWLHGMRAEYNDVPRWRYSEAGKFFGASEEKDSGYPVLGRRVETWSQLQEVLGEESVGDGRGLKLVEIMLDPEDVPEKAKAGLKRASEALRSG